MILTVHEFSYDNCNLMKNMEVFDISVSVLPPLNPDFKRYIRILEGHGICSTRQMATAYLKRELRSSKGLGRTFFVALRDFFDCQHKYRELYKQLHEKEELKHEP